MTYPRHLKRKSRRKRDQCVVARGGAGREWGVRELGQGGQRHKLPVIRYICAEDVTYNMITTVNNALWDIWKLAKRLNFETTHYEENIILLI